MTRMIQAMRPGWLGLWLCLGLLLPWHAVAEDQTWLWKIESPGNTPSYLFGTIHIDDSRVTEFSPELRNALAQTSTFLMEIVPQFDIRHTLVKKGSLADQLKPAELEQLRQLADLHAIPQEIALRMKPWLLASIFSLPEARSPFTQDNVLYGQALSSSKGVAGLETPEQHFNILDEIPAEEQLQLLRAVLAKPSGQKEKEFQKVVDAYLRKEPQALLAEDVLLMEGMSPETSRKMIDLLLNKRNKTMAEGILRHLKKGPVFAAVGASHLPGEHGLIALLREAGYQVSGVRESSPASSGR